MRNRSRCLNRIVSSVGFLYGTGIIVYCLCLLKIWQNKISGLPTLSSLKTPLFIQVCLAIGIALCLSNVFGFVVANCSSDRILLIYIVFICAFLLSEIAVVFTIYLGMDWVAIVNESIEEKYSGLRSFALINIGTCRIILIVSLVPQISGIAVAINMRVVGAHRRMSACGNHSAIPDFRHSFLVLPISRLHDNSTS